MYNFCTSIKIIFLDSRFRGKALLHGPKNLFGVTPWLDHGTHKNNKNTNNFSILTGSVVKPRDDKGEIDPRNNASRE